MAGAATYNGTLTGLPYVRLVAAFGWWMALELLVFEIDGAAFGVPASQACEVLRAAALFPLPQHGPAVAGGLDLRGDIVPVLDGRALLSKAGRPLAPSDHFIVLEGNRRRLAMWVDRAVELATVEFEDVESGGTESGSPGQLVSEVANSSRGPIAIVNVSELAAAAAPADASESGRGADR